MIESNNRVLVKTPNNQSNEISWHLLNISILSLYFITIFIAEIFYRDIIFNTSVEYQAFLSQQNRSLGVSIFKLIAKLGEKAVFIPIYAFLVTFFPLNKSISFIVILLATYYIQSTLKVIYHNERPYFDQNYYFINFSCDSGYGNPSGHATSVTAMYLAFSKIICSHGKIKDRLTYKLIITTVLLCIMILIYISRFYLLAHSINQIIHGFLIGIGIYYIFYEYIQIQEITEQYIFEQFSKINSSFILKLILIVILCSLAFILYFTIPINQNSSDYLDTICNDISPLKIFNTDSLFQSLGIVALLGIVLGFYILIKFLPENGKQLEIFSFNKLEKLSHYGLLILILGGIFAVSYLPWFILSFCGITNLPLNILFGIPFPTFMFVFLIHSLLIIWMLKFKSSQRVEVKTVNS